MRLAERGVLMLVEGPESRLGEVVRSLIAEWPETEVLLRAPQLAELSPGSTAVLCLRAQDFSWLNSARPAVLGHRLVLFGDPETVTSLSQQAFDFFDWISHRIEAPAGPPSFAVDAFKRAVCARPRVIAWAGGDLEATFHAARPGQTLSRVSAAQPYEAIVAAMRPAARRWVAVTDAGEDFTLRRARWAAAEVGRAGRTIVIEPAEVPEGAPVVEARTLPIEAAESMLREAGIERPARAAALLGLEPDAIERACAERGGTALKSDAPSRGEAWSKRLPAWREAVDEAMRERDYIVAEHLIARWRLAAPEDPRALLALAGLEALRRKTALAKTALEEVRKLAPSPDGHLRFEMLLVEALILDAMSDFEGLAIKLKEATALGRRLHVPDSKLAELLRMSGTAMLQVGKLKNATALLREARALSSEPSVNESVAAATTILAFVGGMPAGLSAAQALPDELREDHADTSFERLDRAHQDLMQLITQRRFREADSRARDAIAKAKRAGAPMVYLRYERALALYELGRFAEAVTELRHIFDGGVSPAEGAIARTQLAYCLIKLGDKDEAARVLDEALAYFEGAGRHQAPAFARALYARSEVEFLARRYASAERLLRRMLDLEERSLGKQHPTLIDTLAALGQVLLGEKRARDAETLAKRALKLAETAHDRTGRAVTLDLLASAQADLGHAHAADTARRALEAWKEADKHPSEAALSTLEAIAERRFVPAKSRKIYLSHHRKR